MGHEFAGFAEEEKSVDAEVKNIPAKRDTVEKQTLDEKCTDAGVTGKNPGHREESEMVARGSLRDLVPFRWF